MSEITLGYCLALTHEFQRNFQTKGKAFSEKELSKVSNNQVQGADRRLYFFF